MPKFYCDFVYKLKKTVGSNNFSAQFIKLFFIIKRLAITIMYCFRLYDDIQFYALLSPYLCFVSLLYLD